MVSFLFKLWNLILQIQEEKGNLFIHFLLTALFLKVQIFFLNKFFFLLKNPFRLPCVCFQDLCCHFHKLNYVPCNGLIWIFVSFINLLFYISGPSLSTCSHLILFIIFCFCGSNNMNINYTFPCIHTLQWLCFYCCFIILVLLWLISIVLLSSLLTFATF